MGDLEDQLKQQPGEEGNELASESSKIATEALDQPEETLLPQSATVEQVLERVANLNKAKEVRSISTNIVRLESGIKSKSKGWEYSTEDISGLISGLSEVETKGGGFLGIGSFHNLDIALDRQADTIVLMDIDRKIVNLNYKILQLIEKTDTFEDMLPNLLNFIKTTKTDLTIDFFLEYISEGANINSRTPLSWAKDPKAFLRLKELIKQGKVAVAHADITRPETMKIVGDFFSSNNTNLNIANLSNIENPGYHMNMRTLERIPNALEQAGATPSTLVINSSYEIN